MKINNKTKEIVLASMFAAIITVTTMVVKIPTPLKGYVNLGDCAILLCAFTISPLYAFLAAGIGSAFADLFSGYVVYAPATFVIKGAIALIAYYLFKVLSKKAPNTLSYILSALVAEIFMVLGYYIFEGFLYGFIPSAVNIIPNALQGLTGIVLGCILTKLIKKTKIAP